MISLSNVCAQEATEAKQQRNRTEGHNEVQLGLFINDPHYRWKILQSFVRTFVANQPSIRAACHLCAQLQSTHLCGELECDIILQHLEKISEFLQVLCFQSCSHAFLLSTLGQTTAFILSSGRKISMYMGLIALVCVSTAVWVSFRAKMKNSEMRATTPLLFSYRDLCAILRRGSAGLDTGRL